MTISISYGYAVHPERSRRIPSNLATTGFLGFARNDNSGEMRK